ncbi:MAG: TetR/AcrR family transcriptional regulator, partial [Actinomycetota bacterium]
MKQRKLTQRGSRRREQIVETALRLFAENGYQGTTVGDVCDSLGVGKGV